MEINIKLNKLKKILISYKKILLAFSGGVDSTFLLYVTAQTLGINNITAVTALSETYPSKELKLAIAFAKKLKVEHIILKTEELKNDNFSKNPFNRCFYCKDELFMKLSQLAKKKGQVLCDASNLSDLKDYRPGRKAIRKWKVRSPLLLAGITKADVRALSKSMGLDTWDMPAQACLASRIAYNTEITEELLKRIEKAENFLGKLGFKNFRVRHHGSIARIELDKNSIEDFFKNRTSEKVLTFLQKCGWHYITLDLNGYKTGSMNLFTKTV